MRFNETLKNLKVYEAGKPIELVVREFGIDEKEIVKLASNENPYGTSSKVVEAIKENAHKAYLYPDDSMFELKEGLSKRFGVEKENIIIGAGSDQVLEFCARAILNPTAKVLMSKVTFAMYEIYALQQGAKILRSSSYNHDLEEFYSIYQKEKPQLIHICTPNNPTGDALDKEEVFRFLEKVKEPLVVIDGAYMEYASFKDSKKRIEPKELIKTFPNAIYLGTFSKAYGLGGMRVGYGIGDKEIIQQLYKLRPPFNITTLSLIAATKALEDEEFVNTSVKNNFEEMKRYEEFARKREIEFIPSYTNFITYFLPSSPQIANKLLRKGIIVRDLSSYGLSAIRVTVGTPKQNTLFFEKFEEVLEDGD